MSSSATGSNSGFHELRPCHRLETTCAAIATTSGGIARPTARGARDSMSAHSGESSRTRAAAPMSVSRRRLKLPMVVQVARSALVRESESER